MILSGVLITLSALNAQAGTINGQIQTASSGPVRNGTLTLTLNQVANVPGVAQIVGQPVQCYTDNFGNIVGEPDQTTAPSASVNLGSGTLAAGTYFVKTALQDTSGVSNVSPEASFTLSAPGTLIVTAPGVQPANASGFRIYIGTASGNETLQGTVTGTPGTWANFSQSAALSAGSAMPVANTTVCTFNFQDSMIPTTTYYTINLVNSGGSKIAGYPVSQVRFYGGTNGSVNISNGWPMSIGGVVYPSPIVSTPAANAEQSIASNLNLNGFTLKAGIGVFTGNVTFGGGNPWFDVTSSIFNAVCDGSHDDTIPIQAAVAAARLLGADVRFPNGKTCVMATSSSPAINLDEAINTSLLCGTGAGRSRPGGGTDFVCAIKFTGNPAIGVGARASFGVAINGMAILGSNTFTGNLIDTSHFPGDTRCGGSPCDTENFNLSNSTISASVLCTNGVSMDKTIISNVTNNHFFGCINQLKGPSGAGSYANVIKVLDNDFNGSLGVLCYINNIGESWNVERNTIEVNNSVASTICNSGGNADAKGFVFKGNWDGDDASTGVATKYVLPAGLRGAQISANTISNVHAATNLFNIGNNSKGVSIFGNTYYVGSSYNVMYTLGTGVELDIGTNDYQGVTLSTFMSGSPVAGTISFSNGDKYTFGHQAVNLPLNVTPLSSLHVRAQSANSTGGLPTIFGAGLVVDGAVDVTSGGGTAKVYGIIGTARTVNSTSTEKAYAGWFKSFGFSGSAEEVALHAEVTDAGTSSTTLEGQVQSVQKFRFDGDGSFYLTKLLMGAPAPTISSGFGTSPTVPTNNGSAAFNVNVGTGGTATNGVVAMNSTATTGWNCSVNNLTAAAGHRADNTVQTASSTTTVTIENQTKSTGAAVAWTASDIIRLSCWAN